MIRPNIISVISPHPPYGFQTYLVSTERYFQGESNAVNCEEFGGELGEDIEYYQELTDWHR